MPEALTCVQETAVPCAPATVPATAPSVRDLSRMPPQLRAHAFPPHNNANPKGRPIGSSATKIVARKESKIAQRYVDKVLTESDGEEAGRMLRHAMDKLVPDAGKDNLSVNLSLNYAALTIPATRRPTTRMDAGVPSMDSTTTPAIAPTPSLSPTE